MAKAGGPTIRRGAGPYYAQVPWALQDDPAADAEMISVYAALQRYADFGGEHGCRAKDSEAAQKAKVSVRTFVDRRQKLRDLGWIDWASGKVAGKPNEYVIHRVPVSRQGYAPGADPSAGPADQYAPPADPVPPGVQTPTTNREPLPKARTEADPDRFQLAGYIDLHQEMLPGSVAPSGVMADVFPELEKRGRAKYPGVPIERIREQVLKHQRHYLMAIKAENNGARYLSYPRFAQTFSEWGKAPNGGRPLAQLQTGKDYGDGMKDLERKPA